MLRDAIRSAQTSAMKAHDRDRVEALRFIQAAIKNRDIEARTETGAPDDDALVTGVLQKLAKQHRESIRMFEDGGRSDAAAKESAELVLIEEFLPKMLDDADTRAAVDRLIAETGAAGPKDMGRVMAAMKKTLAGQIDMGRASAIVKEALSSL